MHEWCAVLLQAAELVAELQSEPWWAWSLPACMRTPVTACMHAYIPPPLVILLVTACLHVYIPPPLVILLVTACMHAYIPPPRCALPGEPTESMAVDARCLLSIFGARLCALRRQNI